MHDLDYENDRTPSICLRLSQIWPTLARAKERADYGFVSGVSDVSAVLNDVEGLRKSRHRGGGISAHSAARAGTAETNAATKRVSR
jgi:hypothetical protein